MKEDEVVPDKLSNPLNYKIIILIIAGIIILHTVINTIDELGIIVYSWSMAVPFAIIISSFWVARKYSGAMIYSKAFKLLGISFIGIFGGEVIYFIYEAILGLDPYPSIGDAFYYMFYPAIIGFLIINIQFFSPKFTKRDTIPIITIPLIISGIWTYLVWGEWIGFDFWFGLASILATSTTLGFSILALKTFRGGMIQTTWVLFVIGILSIVIGDTWYYYLEIFEKYTLDHVVNLFWYFGYLFILYSLIKHKKTI